MAACTVRHVFATTEEAQAALAPLLAALAQDTPPQTSTTTPSGPATPASGADKEKKGGERSSTDASDEAAASPSSFLRGRSRSSPTVQFPKGTLIQGTRLDLCKQGLGPRGTQLVCESLKNNSFVEALLMGADGLGPEGAGYVSELVEVSTSLRTVFLGCNGVGDSGTARLVEAIEKNPSVIEGLWLKRNNIGPEGAAALNRVLIGPDCLNILDLSCNRLGDEGVVNLLSGLGCGTTLSTIYLCGNNVGPRGLAALFEVIAAQSATTRGITTAYINRNPFKDEGAAAIAAVLQTNPCSHLTYLNVGSCGFTPTGVVDIVNSLSTNTTLKTLFLGLAKSTYVIDAVPNVVGTEGAEAIGELLKVNTTLEVLHLTSSGITQDGAVSILEGMTSRVARNAPLKALDIGGNDISAKTRSVLRRLVNCSGGETAIHSRPALVADIASVYRVGKSAKKQERRKAREQQRDQAEKPVGKRDEAINSRESGTLGPGGEGKSSKNSGPSQPATVGGGDGGLTGLDTGFVVGGSSAEVQSPVKVSPFVLSPDVLMAAIPTAGARRNQRWNRQRPGQTTVPSTAAHTNTSTGDSDSSPKPSQSSSQSGPHISPQTNSHTDTAAAAISPTLPVQSTSTGGSTGAVSPTGASSNSGGGCNDLQLKALQAVVASQTDTIRNLRSETASQATELQSLNAKVAELTKELERTKLVAGLSTGVDCNANVAEVELLLTLLYKEPELRNEPQYKNIMALGTGVFSSFSTTELEALIVKSDVLRAKTYAAAMEEKRQSDRDIVTSRMLRTTRTADLNSVVPLLEARHQLTSAKLIAGGGESTTSAEAGVLDDCGSGIENEGSDADTDSACEATSPAVDSGSAADAATNGAPPPAEILLTPRHCHICHAAYWAAHFFYDLMCNDCAADNYQHRLVTGDLSGRVAIVTGGRLKIGYKIALKLLRAGAEVLVTTRFPNDASLRYSLESDFEAWADRLHIYGPLDLKDILSVHAFTAAVKERYDAVDIVINNAAQTVRRPPQYFEHLRAVEESPPSLLPPQTRGLRLPLGPGGDARRVPKPWSRALEDGDNYYSGRAVESARTASGVAALLDSAGSSADSSAGSSASSRTASARSGDLRVSKCGSGDSTNSSGGPSSGDGREASEGVVNDGDASSEGGGDEDGGNGEDASTPLGGSLEGVVKFDGSQPAVVAEGTGALALVGAASGATAEFPPDCYDKDGQQVDLRHTNSWMSEIDAVSPLELAEVHAVNSLAPFVINGELRDLLTKSSFPDRYIVNVSATEGQFSRSYKTPRHPHTNMAKASLNMMTRTCGPSFATQGIYMTAVDTGWVTDECPTPMTAAKTDATGARWEVPLDEEDGAARVLHPVFAGVNDGEFIHTAFLKHYRVCEW